MPLSPYAKELHDAAESASAHLRRRALSAELMRLLRRRDAPFTRRRADIYAEAS